MHRDRLPARTAVDLIGLVRSVYFVWQAADVPAATLEELLHLGRELRDALELSLRSKPGSLDHRAAWVQAERATAALCVLIGTDRPDEFVELLDLRHYELISSASRKTSAS
jgi:hypothetical protein